MYIFTQMCKKYMKMDWVYCVTRWRLWEEKTYYKGCRGDDLLHGNRPKLLFQEINGPAREKTWRKESQCRRWIDKSNYFPQWQPFPPQKTAPPYKPLQTYYQESTRNQVFNYLRLWGYSNLNKPCDVIW